MVSGPNQAAAQLRELGDDELAIKLRESKEELFNLRFQSATGQLSSNHRLRGVRTDIARIYTVLRERELGIAFAPVLQSTKEAKADKSSAAQLKAENADAEKAEPQQVTAQQVKDKDEVNA